MGVRGRRLFKSCFFFAIFRMVFLWRMWYYRFLFAWNRYAFGITSDACAALRYWLSQRNQVIFIRHHLADMGLGLTEKWLKITSCIKSYIVQRPAIWHAADSEQVINVAYSHFCMEYSLVTYCTTIEGIFCYYSFISLLFVGCIAAFAYIREWHKPASTKIDRQKWTNKERESKSRRTIVVVHDERRQQQPLPGS